jgi:hypothetical protein
LALPSFLATLYEEFSAKGAIAAREKTAARPVRLFDVAVELD